MSAEIKPSAKRSKLRASRVSETIGKLYLDEETACFLCLKLTLL